MARSSSRSRTGENIKGETRTYTQKFAHFVTILHVTESIGHGSQAVVLKKVYELSDNGTKFNPVSKTQYPIMCQELVKIRLVKRESGMSKTEISITPKGKKFLSSLPLNDKSFMTMIGLPDVVF